MNQLIEKMIGIIYPRRCPICGGVLNNKHGAMICPGCEKHVRPIREPMCKKCGKPLEIEEREYCHDCQSRQHLFARGAALLTYEGKVKESIYQMKFHNKREYLDYYGWLMGRELEKTVRKWNADMLIPVPLHWYKNRQRGFNQAELLADKLAAAFQIPMNNRLVVRQRHTKPQKELLLKERRKNLKGAFALKQGGLMGKRIIIVDDIYTTGATIDEIAGLLLAAGAEKVYFLALCIGRADW